MWAEGNGHYQGVEGRPLDVTVGIEDIVGADGPDVEAAPSARHHHAPQSHQSQVAPEAEAKADPHGDVVARIAAVVGPPHPADKEMVEGILRC